MIYSTLMDCKTLEQNLKNVDWVLVDCRFSLQDTDVGFLAYKNSHIPGAVYAHLDKDLCGPPLTDFGRHPLPSPASMADFIWQTGY